MCELSKKEQGHWDIRNKCLSVSFKVCVNTAWIDVWECMLAHSCEQMRTEHVKGPNMGEWSGLRVTAQYS